MCNSRSTVYFIQLKCSNRNFLLTAIKTKKIQMKKKLENFLFDSVFENFRKNCHCRNLQKSLDFIKKKSIN